ncbi:MAG: pantoate--beta-alanine ligase [Armatimonadetes bacterium]|nr:pantoate--beta-alanine ligase [Armatimonadota bacterium]
MKLIHTISETRNQVLRARLRGWKIGLVPTMGALHDGHMSLVRRAKAECEFVVVSIFVNPTQFGPGEDFDKYPRTLVEDVEKCRISDVDVVFTPSASEMYPEGFNSWVEVKGYLTETLEGEFRPGHFRGVTTVCAKLFNIVQPTCAYFGQKDYQQLKVVQKMVNDLSMPLEIVPCEIVREPDGLAMSSRNSYLSPEERKAAVVLSRALSKARAAVTEGERNAAAVQEIAEGVIRLEPLASIDYVALRDAETLQPIDRIRKPAVLLLAVRIGKTRLIDNAFIPTN